MFHLGNRAHCELGYVKGDIKSPSKPKFVDEFDSCMVTELAYGKGCTLFLFQDKNGDDKKTFEMIPKLNELDASGLIERLVSKRGDGRMKS